jgi:hypothetical protein
LTAIWAGRPGLPDDAACNHLLRAQAGLLPYGADGSVLLPDAKFTGKSAEIGRTRIIFRGLRAKTFRRGHSWNLCKLREYSTAYVRPAGDETRFRSSEFRATPFVQFMEPVNLTALRITIVHACATPHFTVAPYRHRCNGQRPDPVCVPARRRLVGDQLRIDAGPLTRTNASTIRDPVVSPKAPTRISRSVLSIARTAKTA